jgi:5-methyltetrahydrofolate--homocysteine methyltransferase
LSQRVLVFDGAMGTSLHARDLPLSDYRGLENCSEILNETRPDVIEAVHRSFLDAGCDAIETNTFGGMKHVLAEFDLAPRCYELGFQAAQIARRACDGVMASAPGAPPRFAVGSLGPGTKLISLRQIDYDTMVASYYELARALLDGGVDALLIETCQDLLQTKCAIQAVRQAFDKTGRHTPLMVSVTMETTGTMLVGSDLAAALAAIEVFPEVDVIGLNCATGPQEMAEHVRFLSRYASRCLSVMPNAGLPQLIGGRTHFPLSPAELARWLREFVESDGVRVVGGCCGTTPEHLAAVVEQLGARSAPVAPRSVTHEPACSSLYQAVPYRQDNSFLIVGERCNTNGSRKFKQLLADGDLDGCVHMALEQIKEEGAHVLDVCVDYVGRDGVPDMHDVIERFSREAPAPLMLDSTQPDVVEAGLKLAGGKCIINSVNLEDGEEKLARVCGLARQYGAAVVALTIDEDPVEAMGKTAERKLAIAARLRELITRRHGLNEEDIFFDCLTFPITTGNESDRRLALETLDAIEALTKRFPRCQSILGLSNVSFGLQPAARVVLNSVFLHEARNRGLSAAIVHPGKILPRNQISDERWNAATDLIYDRDAAALERFIGCFSDEDKVVTRARISDLPLEERLKRRIIDGNRQGLTADLEQARERHAPLAIINDILLEGMRVVGELFGSGQMQLPFVLKSAETMKAAVAALEPFMEKTGGASRGKIVLATVRGDVHDIGKNLVDILLSNNGYTVYNLGIKQPINNVIAAWRENQADVIGLSGLLVKSTLVMRDDLLVLNEQGLNPPVILGGAALTRRYVEEDLRPTYQGPLYYAKDAFEGLGLMKRIIDGGREAPALAEAVGAARPRSAASIHSPPGNEPTTGARPAPARALDQAGAATGAASGASRLSSAERLAIESEQRFGLREIAESDDGDSGSAPSAAPAAEPSLAAAERLPASPARRSDIRHEQPVPQPPFWGARVIERIELKAALAYVNETMLFQVQWGFRKKGRSPEAWKQYVDREIRPIYRELVERCEREGIFELRAAYGYWPCAADGDDLIIFEPRPAYCAVNAARDALASPAGPSAALARAASQPLRQLARFSFPRQSRPPYWCLADFWRPLGSEPVVPSAPAVDVVAFQIVTAGRRVSEVAREWFAANDYQRYLFLHGLGVETAEALAELIHRQIRIELGIAGQDARERQALFKQGYQGSRLSFGYPACPRLEDQATLMELLQAERIGITLSEEYQLEPEQSTSAIVTSHPQARYFAVT